MYESEVKTAVPKIIKVTKDSQVILLFIFGLMYVRLSKTFESYLVLWDTLNRVTTFLRN